jgi:hypothetical protein
MTPLYSIHHGGNAKDSFTGRVLYEAAIYTTVTKLRSMGMVPDKKKSRKRLN